MLMVKVLRPIYYLHIVYFNYKMHFCIIYVFFMSKSIRKLANYKHK